MHLYKVSHMSPDCKKKNELHKDKYTCGNTMKGTPFKKVGMNDIVGK